MAGSVVVFEGGGRGAWRVERIAAAVGDALPDCSRLAVTTGPAPGPAAPEAGWALRGFVSNTRYTERAELDDLTRRQEGLGRPAATLAALIPIRKTEAWWTLAQDERRAVFEAQSRHIAIGMEYLPSVARRLHHSRDLGEPFDFLTWFEYAPEDSLRFEDLVARLRDTPEWRYVDREVDVRLAWDGPPR